MPPKDVERMANREDPDQTAPWGAVWSGSALFAQTYLSQYLKLLRYNQIISMPTKHSVQTISTPQFLVLLQHSLLRPFHTSLPNFQTLHSAIPMFYYPVSIQTVPIPHNPVHNKTPCWDP